MSDVEVPKDLGIKIGTPEEVIWTDAAKTARGMIEGLEKEVIIQKGLLIHAEKRIAEEKKKFK